MRGVARPLLGGILLSAGVAVALGMQRADLREVATQTILDQDPRLERTVTLRLGRNPLSSVTEALGRQIGVTLTASQDAADEPAILFVTRLPAKEVMHHLASLFNFRWRRRGTPGKFSYELYQDLRSKLEERRLRDRARTEALDELEQALRERLQLLLQPPEALLKRAKALDAASDAMWPRTLDGSSRAPGTTLSPSELRVLAHRELAAQRLREMADLLQRELLRVAAALPAEQWRRLVNGESLLFSADGEPGLPALPIPSGQALRAARPRLGEPGLELHFDSPEDESKAQHVQQIMERDWTDAKAIRIAIWLDLVPIALGPLSLESYPGEAHALQATLSVVPIEVHPPEDERHSHPSGAYGLRVAGQEVPFAGEGAPDAQPATPSPGSHDPVLTKECQFEFSLPNGPEALLRFQLLNRVLPRIAEVYEINLIADAYWQRLPIPVPPSSPGARTLVEVLNRYVLPGARWSHEGTFIHVRRYHWYNDREREIPQRFVNEWSARLRRERQLSLDAAADLVLSLRDEQMENLAHVLKEEGIEFISTGAAETFLTSNPLGGREVLRAYASLSDQQRETLRSGQGLPCVIIPPSARAWLHQAVARRIRLPAEPFRRWSYGSPMAVTPDVPPTMLSLSVSAVESRQPGHRRGTRVSFLLEYAGQKPALSFIENLPLVDVIDKGRPALDRPVRQ